MANVRGFRAAFVGGEVSPELVGRVDFDKEQSGLAVCQNFVVLPHGPVQNRAGFAYCASTKFGAAEPARMLPFAFSNTQQFAIELGAGYFRFFADGLPLIAFDSQLMLNPTFSGSLNGWSSGAAASAGAAVSGGALVLTPAMSGMMAGAQQMAVQPVYNTTDGSGNPIVVNDAADLTVVVTAGSGSVLVGSSAGGSQYGTLTLTGTGTFTHNGIVGGGSLSGAAVPVYLTVETTTGLTLSSVSLLGENGGGQGVTNGTFDNGMADWTDISQAAGSLTLVSGGMSINAPSSAPYVSQAQQGVVTAAGQTLTFGLAVTSGSGFLYVGSTPGGSDLLNHAISHTTANNWSFTNTVSAFWVTLVNTSSTALVVSACNLTSVGTNEPYEVPNNYAGADLFDIHYVQSGDIVTLVHPSYPPMELRRYGNTNWTFSQISFDSTMTPPASVTLVVNGSGPYNQNYSYVVTALDADGNNESVASVSSAVNVDLAASGTSVAISWPAVTGAGFYNVYKGENGGAFGYVAQTAAGSTSWLDVNTTPDWTQAPPMQDSVMNSANNYPAAVGYFEQRRVFGGSNNDPETFWATQPGTQNNMNYSIPSQASDRLNVTIAAQRANFIRHIVALLDMIVLTASTEWRVFTASGDALTPSTLTIKAQWQNGASNVQPLVVNNQCLYGSGQGGHVRSLVYDWQLNGYRSDDLCLLARHLFDFETIVDMAFQRSPYPILWAVSSTGKLLGCTFLPEQQIQAWHQHTTAGTFESVCVLTENGFDVVYAVVSRTINGVANRFVERLDPRDYAGVLANAFFVDCGANWTGATGSFTVAGAVYTCDVVNHGLVNGSTHAFNFGEMALSGTFTVSGNTLVCAVAAHTLSTDVFVDLVFSDATYNARYLVTVADGGHFSVAVPVAGASSGAVSFSVGNPNNGIAATVTVVDANHFTATFAAGYAASGAVQLMATTISGLSWLAGSAVSVLADGVVQAGLSVSSSGVLTLPVAASVVQVGLPYTSTLQTLPFAIQGDGSFGYGRVKGINQVMSRCVDFTGCWVGSTANSRLVKVAALKLASDGVTPVLANGEWRKNPWPGLDADGGIVIVNKDPVPLTVCDFGFEVSIGG